KWRAKPANPAHSRNWFDTLSALQRWSAKADRTGRARPKDGESKMPSYRKNEARDWAWRDLKGCANVIIPSYTADLKGLNERGIRHDVRQCLTHGFTSTLLVSETALSLEEYGQFFEYANDESKGRLKLILHASFNNLEENIAAAKIAEANGC